MQKSRFVYRPEDYVLELGKELEMRRKVWVNGRYPARNVMSNLHQERYDILEEVAYIVKALGRVRILKLQEMLESEMVEQGNLFMQ